MPFKKKKQKEEPFVDVMSCLDQVESCLDRAERSSRACLEGITKADMVLRETREDPDIQCVVLVKRTELLFIAAKNNYNLDSLPGARSQYSLDGCIADCERVLNDVSADDVAAKQIRANAKAVCIKSQKLIKDREYEEKKKRGSKSNSKITETRMSAYDPTFKRYDPSRACFKTIDKINPYLLQDIVDCYKQARNYCRTCYYRRHTQEPVVTGRHCRGCKKIPQPLVMIPASKMCENMNGDKYVAVPLPPKMMMQPANKHKAFQICKNRDHGICEDKATIGENWFAHSIEELVIWTVQRHYGCKFHKYIEDHHHDREPPNLSLFSPPPPPSQSEDGVDTDDLFSDSYSDENNSDDERFDYYPEELLFHEVKDIPQSLLLNIIEKYKHVKDYCKWCFYKNNKQGVACTDRDSNQKVCSICGSSWRSIRVLPASEYCWNFGDFDFLPMASCPAGKLSKEPFEYCKKKDHFRCFRVYTDSDFWYPHSVEEMVVWTVEREKKCSFNEFIADISTIPSSGTANGVQHLNQPRQQDLNNPGPAPHPQPGEMNFFPGGGGGGGGGRLYPTGHPAGGVRAPRPPLLNTPNSASQQPLNAGMDAGFPPPSGGPGPNAVVGRPFPPPRPHFPPGSDFQHFNNSSGGGGGGGGGPPMMYLSQPPGPMYPHNRAVLMGRLPMGPAPMVNPHGGMSQQPMHQYPGPIPPHQVIAMPQQTMYNPYLGMAPNFSMYPGPQTVSAPPPGIRPRKPEAVFSESSGGERRNDISDPMARSSPASTYGAALPEKSVASSASGSSANSSPFQTITSAVDRNTGKVSAGRKNYKVAQSPSRGGGGAGGVSSTSTRGGGGAVGVSSTSSRVGGGAGSMPVTSSRGGGGAGGVPGTSSRGGAGGVSSTSRSQSVEVKAVSAAPIPAARVETPMVFKFSDVNFKSFVDIPSALLHSIALCFQDKTTVCRKCFYGERSLSTKSSSQSVGEVALCSTGEHKWLKPVVVIPGCSMCNNEPSFQPGEHVPIPPLPPVAVLKKCSSRNHHKCFTKCLDQDTWQAHSVEELVVWLVESEKDCPFVEYAKVLDGPAGGSLVSALSPVSAKTDPFSSKPTSSSATADISTSARSLFSSPIKSSPPADGPSTKHPPSPPPSLEAKPKSVRKYHPRDFSFVMIEDVPSDLLVSVAECYRSMRVVCRICFFESNCTSLAGKKKERTCMKEHLPWKPIKVIPRSPLCQTQSVYVPLPPLPKHMRQSSVPFVVCKKTDHRTCFAMSKGTNPWFPHTVEELVVWTVEREYAQPFDSVYTEYLPDSGKQSDLASKAAGQLSNSAATKDAGASPTSEYYSNVVVVDSSLDTSKSSTPDWDLGVAIKVGRKYKQVHNPGADASSERDAQEVDEKQFTDALDLKSGGVTSEFPLGSYRSQPRPPLDPDSHSKPQPSQESTNWGESDMLDYFKGLNSEKWWSPGVDEKVEYGSRKDDAHNTSYTMDEYEEYPLRPSDDFIHQSQVENDPFQPYASSKSPLLLPGLIALERSPKLSSHGVKRDGEKLPGLGIDSQQIPKSREIGLEDRDWEDADDAMIEGSGNPSPEDRRAVLSPGDRRSRGVDLSPGGRSSRGPGVRSKGADNNNSLAPGSGKAPGSKSPVGDGLAPGSSFPSSSVVPGSESPWSIGDGKLKADTFVDGLQGVSRFGLESGGGGGLWDNTSWGDHVSSSFMASAVVAANSITSGSGRTLDPVRTSFPSPMQSLDDPSSGIKPSDTALLGSGARVVTDTNNGIGDGKFFCLLCYCAFKTAGELFAHCSTITAHQEIAALDAGAEKVWQHAPPPPKEGNIPMPKVCSSSACSGPPICKHPHSQEELGEWLARWKHRDQRRKEGLRLARVILEGDGKNSVPISASKVLQSTVSDAYKIDNNCCRWDITIQGKNWLNLFGVSISSSSSWIFKITHIEEPVTPSVFHPHSSSWIAPPFHHTPHLRQCLLLGLVEIKVKAIPPSNKKQPSSSTPVSAEVRLDLGFKQYFSIPLQTSTQVVTEGGIKEQLKKHSPVEAATFAPLGNQPTFAPGQLPRFAPQHPWRLSQQSSSSSDDLGNLNMEGEDLTLQHVPIEDWGCSLTDEHAIIEQ